MKRLLILTGDYSGDIHAANVIQALWDVEPELEIAAVGGPRVQALTVPLEENGQASSSPRRRGSLQMIATQAKLGRVGMGAITGLPAHLWLAQKIVRFVWQFKPEAILFIDYGGFHLAMARLLKTLKCKSKLLYFIPPQIWATRKGRIRQLQAYIDHVFCIFPFEKPLYETAGVPVTYVGHPLVGQLPPAADRSRFCQSHGLDPNRPIVAICPGSRLSEVKGLLPAMLGSVPLILKEYPDVQCVIARAGSISEQLILERIPSISVDCSRNVHSPKTDTEPLLKSIQMTTDNHGLLSIADAAILASGTITLEAALYGTPMLLIYRLHPLIFWLAMRLLLLPYIGLPNIIYNRPQAFVPELLQYAITPAAIAQHICPLLDKQSPEYAIQCNGFKEIQAVLNEGNTAQRVAQAILC